MEREWAGKTPSWCYDKVPNVYTYIQDRYWDNRFLGFLYRGPENFITSIPMNLVYLTVTYRVMKANPLGFFTLGIFGCASKDGIEQTNIRKNAVMENEVSVPHVWYMAI